MAHQLESEVVNLRGEVKKLEEKVETHNKMLSSLKKMMEHRIGQELDDRRPVSQDQTQAGKRRRSSFSPSPSESPSSRMSTEEPNTSTVSNSLPNPKKANIGKPTDIGRDPNIADVVVVDLVGADMDVDVSNNGGNGTGGVEEFEEDWVVVDSWDSESDNLLAFSAIRQDQSSASSVAMNTNKNFDADARAPQQATTSAKMTTGQVVGRKEVANSEVDPSMLKNLDQRTGEVVQLKCSGSAEPKVSRTH